MKNKNLIEIIDIPKIKDDGYLYYVQHPDQIPFEIKRVYYIVSPVSGLPRGKHTHKKTRQILFCIQGSVRMVLDDGFRREEIALSEPEKGIMLEPMIWHEMWDMDESTILLILASEKFDPKDYIRNHNEFLRIVRTKKKK